MTRLLILASTLFVSAVSAQVEIPHVHENGDVIDANEINQNLDIVAKAVPPRDCSTNQIIKWDGSAWVCASRSIVKNDCGTTGDQCFAYCPAGTTVTGGGCYNNQTSEALETGEFLNIIRHVSIPTGGLDGWECSSSRGRVLKAYAICQ